MDALNTPVKEIYCECYQMTTKPSFQVKLSVDEWKQGTACIGWMCSNCWWNNLTADDLSTL